MKPNKTIDNLYKVHLYVTTSSKKAKYALSDIDDPEGLLDVDDIEVAANLYSEDERRIVVYFPKYFKTLDFLDQIAIISHEAYHSVNIIREWIGETGDVKEFEAYLIEYLVKHMIRKTKIIDKKIL